MHPAAPSSVLLALTLDRGLRLEIEPALLPLLSGWAPVATSTAPAVVTPAVAGAVGGATIRVTARAESAPAAPMEEPHVRQGGVRCWVDDEAETALLRGVLGGWARLDLAHGAGTLVAPPLPAAESHAESIDECAAAAELRALCTVAIALLAGRREGVLVAASAVIAPDGGGWLLVGDAHSGKSSTLANLVTAGWGFLGDEEVLLHAGDRGGVWLEGWPRPLPVDPSALPVRGRYGETMGGLARGRWRRTAPLAGILTTRLAPDLPTQLAEATHDATLAGLVRATPWLLADSGSARYQLGLLRTAARVPGWTLRLGRDTQGDVARLAKMLRPLEAAS